MYNKCDVRTSLYIPKRSTEMVVSKADDSKELFHGLGKSINLLREGRDTSPKPVWATVFVTGGGIAFRYRDPYRPIDRAPQQIVHGTLSSTLEERLKAMNLFDSRIRSCYVEPQGADMVSSTLDEILRVVQGERGEELIVSLARACGCDQLDILSMLKSL